MDLIPKSHVELSSTEYWDSFFKKRGSKVFEWYGEYSELSGVLHKYIKPADKVLVVGCGNSRLSEDLYDIGYRNIVNIDIIDSVIKQMKLKNAKKRPEMVYEKMDMLDMEYKESDFNVVLDKSTLDAMMPDSSEEVLQKVDRMFSEINRVMKIGGRYICISLSQKHILQKVLDYFPNEGWMVRVHQVHESSSDDSDGKELQFPVFAFVCTKFKKMPQMQNRLLELCLDEDRPAKRVETTQDILAAVEERQNYAMLRHNLVKGSHAGADISLDLYSNDSPTPRYTLYVVDNSQTKGPRYKFAIFIVPQGREPEWMFGNPEGRRQLAASAGFQRLVVVSLHRDHNYENMDSIKKELSSKVMELAPAGLDKRSQVPFLSVGDDIGQRTIQYRGHSDLSGDFVVEDVEVDNKQLFRRLIFQSNQNVVQSEARLKTERKRKGKSGKKKGPLITTLDHSYLNCEHHITMATGLTLLPDFETLLDQNISLLLIGLGGGGLAMFMHKHFPKVHVTAVELDPAIVDVSKKWFGFVEDDRMNVFVGDGLKFIEEKATEGNEKYDLIMLDADSKDSSVGMSCPPAGFVEREFLQKVSSILKNSGIFIVNLVCRDATLKSTVFKDLKSVFPRIYCKKIEDQVNEVVFALKDRTEDKPEQLAVINKLCREKAGKLQTVAKQHTDSWIAQWTWWR
ncbi:eEF1A lysine and N-terminal methyltransferase-like [Ptychodera flava]|uniref:eEF1A lysine and N-terminal methyltransferase-like n=1 Tax=Ptychodera flava TaxID=63121 RepID=UPI00396A65A2